MSDTSDRAATSVTTTDLRCSAVVNTVLDDVEGTLGVVLDRASVTYGWQGKTAGFATQSNPQTWLRISCRPVGDMNERIWTGEECASVLIGVAKPTLLRSLRWLDADGALVWRADELTHARSEMISATPEIVIDPGLPTRWWRELKRSLAALTGHRTVRVGARQDLMNRRVAEISGGSVDPTVEEWSTAHADLHWANLTAPQCEILDWEGWGIGPRGLDAAYRLALAYIRQGDASPAIGWRVRGVGGVGTHRVVARLVINSRPGGRQGQGAARAWHAHRNTSPKRNAHSAVTSRLCGTPLVSFRRTSRGPCRVIARRWPTPKPAPNYRPVTSGKQRTESSARTVR